MVSPMILDSLNAKEIPAFSDTGRQSPALIWNVGILISNVRQVSQHAKIVPSENQRAPDKARSEFEAGSVLDSTKTLSQMEREPNTPSETAASESLSVSVRPSVRDFISWHSLKKLSEKEMSVEERNCRDPKKSEPGAS
jgi:hypothetical protein